jgi:Zn-dependent peptidase ImmA (M78 family)/DNA-binding transcriptional regulator YiaG
MFPSLFFCPNMHTQPDWLPPLKPRLSVWSVRKVAYLKIIVKKYCICIYSHHINNTTRMSSYNISNRLGEVRDLANLSQTDLAKRLGVSSSLVSHWESGTRVPSETQVMEMSRALGVSVDYLLNAEGVCPRFKFRAFKTTSPKAEVEQVLKDASQQIYFIDTAFRMAGKTLKPFRLKADFSAQQLPDMATQFREGLRLNRRVTLGELKEALAEWDVSVFDWAMPSEISGLSYRGATTAIIINKLHTKQRKLFTLAHEFGHVLFHLARGNSGEETAVSIIASNRDPMEKEANQFASELLMPTAEITALVQESGNKLRERVGLAMASQTFNVSVDAMFYRLANQGLFRWDEKSKYISQHIQQEAVPPFRVCNLKEHVSKQFLHTAISLHENEKISAGKLAEWLFAPRAKVEEYLADLRKDQENGIGDGEDE